MKAYGSNPVGRISPRSESRFPRRLVLTSSSSSSPRRSRSTDGSRRSIRRSCVSSSSRDHSSSSGYGGSSSFSELVHEVRVLGVELSSSWRSSSVVGTGSLASGSSAVCGCPGRKGKEVSVKKGREKEGRKRRRDEGRDATNLVPCVRRS